MPDKKAGVSPATNDVFVVDIKFRQNGTWQGAVKCANDNREMNFRSALELLKLIDGVLEERHPEDREP